MVAEHLEHLGSRKNIARAERGVSARQRPDSWLHPWESLVDLVRLVEPAAGFPHLLYPGGRKTNKAKRIGQLAFGYGRLAALRLRGREAAILHGRSLAYVSGWVTIKPSALWRKELSVRQYRQSFIPIAMPVGGLAGVLEGVGLDAADTLEALVNQNGQFIIRGTWHGEPCFMHYGANATGHAAIRRHGRGAMAALATLRGTIGELIPSFCFELNREDAYAYVERAAIGTLAEIGGYSEAELTRFIEAAIEPLERIHRRAAEAARVFDDGFIVGELSRIAETVRHAASNVAEAVDLLRRWVRTRRPLSVPTHGDYAPRNLFLAEQKITGIIDWEWFWDQGIAGFDAVKLTVEVEALKRRTDIAEVLGHVIARKALGEDFDGRMALIRQRFDLAPEDLWHLALLIWLRVVWMGCVETPPIGSEWLETILRPGQAISLADTHHE